jgi:hypothetical protein
MSWWGEEEIAIRYQEEKKERITRRRRGRRGAQRRGRLPQREQRGRRDSGEIEEKPKMLA